ncbi:MAG TPA: hypothetical protein PLT64_07840 [Syntrophales bacterium]|nr:hypothetical protein [Syntrophales bacterium]HOL59756.1 hypothetical protein [Syntrophales bacterium]HPO35934.1 hypothetical protein [Syntrophales bacterium]
MVKNPFLLKNIALVVVDELQEIGDPDRGPGLVITPTKIVSSPHRPQVIGLSAVLGNTDALARWLGADLLSFDKRPVELHEGVLSKGIFHYRTHNTLEKNSEPLAEIDFEDLTEVLLANVAHLVGKGDQVLVFLPSKLDTILFAGLLAERVDLASSAGALDELALLEETSLKEKLVSCLGKAVAFHHADLSTQLVSRLRNELRSLTLKKDGRIIENNGSGCYRLSIPPRNVTIDTESLMMHWNAVIKDMAASMSE